MTRRKTPRTILVSTTSTVSYETARRMEEQIERKTGYKCIVFNSNFVQDVSMTPANDAPPTKRNRNR